MPWRLFSAPGQPENYLIQTVGFPCRPAFRLTCPQIRDTSLSQISTGGAQVLMIYIFIMDNSCGLGEANLRGFAQFSQYCGSPFWPTSELSPSRRSAGAAAKRGKTGADLRRAVTDPGNFIADTKPACGIVTCVAPFDGLRLVSHTVMGTAGDGVPSARGVNPIWGACQSTPSSRNASRMSGRSARSNYRSCSPSREQYPAAKRPAKKPDVVTKFTSETKQRNALDRLSTLSPSPVSTASRAHRHPPLLTNS